MRKKMTSLLLLCLLMFSSMSFADRRDIPPLFDVSQMTPPGQTLLLE